MSQNPIFLLAACFTECVGESFTSLVYMYVYQISFYLRKLRVASVSAAGNCILYLECIPHTVTLKA